jgi:hypothetical protein
MKTLFISALMVTSMAMMTSPLKAQYDDDIYYSKSSAKKTAYEDTPTWETSANSDWNVDDYNRRTSDDASFHIEWPESTTQTTASTPDTVYVVEQYYYTDRISRFHNPLLSIHLNSPFFDVAFYDPFYWDYCYYDPWWYVTPSFGFRYGSWYLGWNPGYYTGWYGGWYAPYYRPMPHYFQPGMTAGGHHFGAPLPNRGSRVNNVGGHYRQSVGAGNLAGRGQVGRGSQGRTQSAGNNISAGRGRGEAAPGRTQGGASYTPGRAQGGNTPGRATATPSVNASSLGRNSNMRANGTTSSTSRATAPHSQAPGRVSSSSSAPSRSTGATSATTTSPSRTSSTSRSSATSHDNSSARRSDNGVRQSSTGRSTVSRSSSSSSSSNSSTSRSSQPSRSSSSQQSVTRSSSSSSSSSSSRSSGGFSGGSSRGSSGGGGGRSGGGRR